MQGLHRRLLLMPPEKADETRICALTSTHNFANVPLVFGFSAPFNSISFCIGMLLAFGY